MCDRALVRARRVVTEEVAQLVVNQHIATTAGGNASRGRCYLLVENGLTWLRRRGRPRSWHTRREWTGRSDRYADRDRHSIAVSIHHKENRRVARSIAGETADSIDPTAIGTCRKVLVGDNLVALFNARVVGRSGHTHAYNDRSAARILLQFHAEYH